MSSKLLDSKLFRIVVLSVAGLIVLSFVFGLGIFVGEKRAEFSFQWAEEYHRNFAGPQQGFFGNFTDTNSQFANSNGVFGTIIKINGNTITTTDIDGDKTEKTISLTTKTIITFQRKNIKLSDLTVGEDIVVIGSPDSAGQISAEFIRVMPSKPTITNNPTTNQ